MDDTVTKISTEFVAFMLCLMSCNSISCIKSPECPCSIGSHGEIVVNCNGRSLTTLPSFILGDGLEQIYQINLKDNKIVEIPAFSFNGTRLIKLDLINNPLTTISNQAFGGIEETLSELLIGGTNSHELSISSIPLLSLTNLELLTISNFNDYVINDTTLKNLGKLKELTLKQGFIENITPLAFLDQSDSLEKLDLSLNKIKELPTEALSLLKNLISLTLSSNSIKTFKDGAFELNKKLKILNVDRLNKPDIEKYAFRGLDLSLEILNLASSRFTDSVLDSFGNLISLTHLHASYNYLTQLNKLLDGSMKFLKFIDLQNNQVTNISRLESNALEALILESNPLTDVAQDAFYGLSYLISLNLNNAKGLKLDVNTFESQTLTLKELRINEVSLSDPHWRSLVDLKALEVLEASRCSFSTIPDFMFRSLSKLKTLVLEGNGVTSLKQRSFVGLESILQDLSLTENQLTTLDECVFYKFNSINVAKLKLDRNPLICDCKMHWLYERIKVLKSQPNTSNLVLLLQWKCEDPDIKFNTLKDEHFSSCPPRTSPQCEEFPVVVLQLSVSEITSNSFLLHWGTTCSSENVQYFLSYGKQDGERQFVEVVRGACVQQVSGLEPSTTYDVSLSAMPTDSHNVTANMVVTTTSWSEDHKHIVIGSVGGCLILLIIILVTTVCLCLSKKKSNVPMVEITDQSRRFVKQVDYTSVNPKPSRPSYIPASHSNRSDIIKSTLDTMSEEEKYRLVNLLTNSRGSLNDLDENRRYDREPISNSGKHVYEEIPDDIYSEIEEDKTV